jgi:hypothetical protein
LTSAPNCPTAGQPQHRGEGVDDAVSQAHHLQVGKAEFLRLAEDRFDAFQHQRDALGVYEVP